MRVRLGEVCEINMGQSPASSTYNEEEKGLPFFQGNADFGEIYPTARIWCDEPTKVAHIGDILISVRAPIGALNLSNCKCCIGRGLAALTVNKNICLQKYLWYVLAGKNGELNSNGTGSTFKAINKNILAETEIPLPSLGEQHKIVMLLDKVSGVIAERRKQVERLDDLVKSRFIEMFGDPVQNPKGWVKKPFLSMGNCKNGMNFHYEDVGIEIHCLGVGDFKDLTVIDNAEKLPKVSLNKMPSEEYLLKDGDIVFVRSNGNKALVGRSVAVYPSNVPTTFSGFCIRYRKTDDAILAPYLLRVLKADSMRQKMVGRGANIQNLNQQILETLESPVPSIELQNQFAAFVQQTDKLELAVQKSLEKLEILKKSLMQQYFG